MNNNSQHNEHFSAKVIWSFSILFLFSHWAISVQNVLFYFIQLIRERFLF